ncbi:MAG: class I SAM-dependent methyltransferase, partial [Halobacteriota archaeon]
MTDAFGRAIRDHARGGRDEPLLHRDGGETVEHPIESFYFTGFDPEANAGDEWLASQLKGPLVDLGAGAGRHALYFQERFETVALEPSPALVETMGDRGVDDAREGDMFALREQFSRDRFGSALANGTQLGLAGSMRGLTAFFGDLAHVTAPDATAVLDCYDPTHPATA